MSKEKDIKIVCDDCMKEKEEIKMTMGIKAMHELGYILSYINTSDNAYYITMRQFEKYDDKGYITDLINFFYCENDGVEVYTNSLKHHCGTRLNRDLLNAILLNFNEIEKEMVKIR